jgi:hypothetical protein
VSALRPCCQNDVALLRRNGGRDALAALTEPERHALETSAHLLEFYLRCPSTSVASGIVALRALVATMQPPTRELLRELIKVKLGDPPFSLWSAISVSERDAIQGALELVKIALDEEADTRQQQQIRELGARLEAMADALQGDLLARSGAARRIVRDLGERGLPGGDLEAAAEAWLARREFGGKA